MGVGWHFLVGALAGERCETLPSRVALITEVIEIALADS